MDLPDEGTITLAQAWAAAIRYGSLQGAHGAGRLVIPPAPGVASSERAGEAVELYWMALGRDVPFTNTDSNRSPKADLR